MSTYAGPSGRIGLGPLFSVLMLFLSLFNLSAAAPLPAPDGQPPAVAGGNDWGDVYPFGMSLDEAMAVLTQLANSPEDATEAVSSFKDELTKAKAGQASVLTDAFFNEIEANPEGYLGALGEMTNEQKPMDPQMAQYMLEFFAGEQVDTSEAPGGIMQDASNDGVAVSDDANNVKKANPGLMDRFSLFGKSKQLVRWMAASLRAMKGLVNKAKTDNKPMPHDAQIDQLRTVQTSTARTQDAAAMSYSEGKAFVIIHEPEGGSIFEQTVRPTIERLAKSSSQFHPVSLPQGTTDLMKGLKLDTNTERFDVQITDASDPAAHIQQSGVIEGTPESPPVSPISPTDPNAPTEPTDPNEPVSPIEPETPTDPNEPTDPNDPKNKPKPGKPAPAKPPKA